MNYLKMGTRVRFTITYGLDTQEIGGIVINYLGNDEYEVEGDNHKNRYIRKQDELRAE